MFFSLEPLYFVKISSNSGAIIVYFDLGYEIPLGGKNSIHKKHLPKTKFKQLLRLKIFWHLISTFCPAKMN